MNIIFSQAIDGFKLLLAMSIAPIYKIFNKEKIYIIGERKDQCQDNGYHLFKYVRENHSNDKFYYCITKDSKHINRIKEMKNIIYYKSFRHYLYYVLADKLICAHAGSCTPDTAITWNMEKRGIISKKRVFIQHGITKETLPQLMYPKVKFHTFVCGAKPEYEFINSKFGFPDGVVKYLGLCRFDNLHNFNVKEQILIMPTWRAWFGITWGDENDDDEFLVSDYYKRYNELINNNELINFLNENNINLIFYPHYEMQKYLKYFNKKNENIIIANPEKYDVQSLLKESKILITDYSSVAFDFAYMRKSIIYYQFDNDEYNSKHYAKGYFDYERDGFGAVVKDIDNLIKEIKTIYYKENRYIERSNYFFTLYDNNNCKRHYQEIVK